MSGVPNGGAGRTTLRAALGFRRIEHVRIEVRPGATIVEVTGVVKRYPRTVRVPLHLATALIAEGVPHTIDAGEPPMPPMPPVPHRQAV